MSKNKKATLSVDEIVSTVSHSAFPCVITEGADDVIVYRRLEDEFAEVGLSVIAAGGRSKVLAVFDRRGEFPPGARVIFLADLDTWIFTGVPEAYENEKLIFTDGYSIENDMYQDGNLESLIVLRDQPTYQSELRVVCEWYSISVARFMRGDTVELKTHPNDLLDNLVRREFLMKLGENESFPHAIHSQVTQGFERVLRGKTLFDLLIRQISGYNSRTLLNFAASRRGPLFQRISRSVQACL